MLYSDKGRVIPRTPSAQITQQPPIAPWFMGPLITPTSQTVPPGFMNLEGYFFANVITGRYGNDWKKKSLPHFHSNQFLLLSYFGLTKWMDITFAPEVINNRTQGISSLVFADLPISLEFQILTETRDNYLPGLKFYVEEVFPTGKYQKLKPERLLTDAGGRGSYQTEIGIVLGRLFHLSGIYYMNLRLNLFYTHWSSVHLKGVNAFGGDTDTNGRIFPGSQYSYQFGLELTLTKNWVFACDAVGLFTDKTTFSGHPGTNPRTGVRADLMTPFQIQFYFAPALEYNFDEAFGIEAGSVFTVAGKNSPSFISGAIALNYYGPVKRKWMR